MALMHTVLLNNCNPSAAETQLLHDGIGMPGLTHSSIAAVKTALYFSKRGLSEWPFHPVGSLFGIQSPASSALPDSLLDGDNYGTSGNKPEVSSNLSATSMSYLTGLDLDHILQRLFGVRC